MRSKFHRRLRRVPTQRMSGQGQTGSRPIGRRVLAAATFAVLVVFTIRPVLALDLSLPADCTIGETCFVLQIVDRDPGPGHADFLCGSLTYDTHKGVDISLPSWRAMTAGVDVLAAAPGRVRAIRDEMPDRTGYGAPAGDIGGRECGNGLVIEHEDGWTTQYCHLARGSVAVRPGQTVASGTPLGRIGASGLAEFPHVHLVLRKDGRVIDPFDRRPAEEPCAPGAESDGHWRPEAGVRYRPGGVLSSGFLERIPEYREVWDTAPALARLSPDAPALVFWAHFYGLRQNDTLAIRIVAPSGETVAEGTHVMPRNRATEFRAVGRRAPEGGWPEGLYRAEARLIRGGDVVSVVIGNLLVPEVE